MWLRVGRRACRGRRLEKLNAESARVRRRRKGVKLGRPTLNSLGRFFFAKLAHHYNNGKGGQPGRARLLDASFTETRLQIHAVAVEGRQDCLPPAIIHSPIRRFVCGRAIKDLKKLPHVCCYFSVGNGDVHGIMQNHASKRSVVWDLLHSAGYLKHAERLLNGRSMKRSERT